MTVVVVVINESKDSLIKRPAVFLWQDVNVLIFYRSPKSFNPNVVLRPATAVHANPHFRMFSARFFPIQAGELTPLIRVYLARLRKESFLTAKSLTHTSLSAA